MLDPRQSGVTITILMPGQGGAPAPVLSEKLNAEPDWIGALAASQEFRMSSQYAAFWEYVDRIAQDIKAAFREDEVPPPISAYFRRLDR